MNTETIIPVALKEFGCYVCVKHDPIKGYKTILDAAMNKDGSIEMDGDEINWVDVTDPPNQKYLDAINDIYGTSFTMPDFGFPVGYDVDDESTYHLIPEVHGHHIDIL